MNVTMSASALRDQGRLRAHHQSLDAQRLGQALHRGHLGKARRAWKRHFWTLDRAYKTLSDTTINANWESHNLCVLGPSYMQYSIAFE